MRATAVASGCVATFLLGTGAAQAVGPTQTELNNAATDGTNWLYADHDYRGQRYTPLHQITAKNAANLAQVCSYSFPEKQQYVGVYSGIGGRAGIGMAAGLTESTAGPTRWADTGVLAPITPIGKIDANVCRRQNGWCAAELSSQARRRPCPTHRFSRRSATCSRPIAGAS